MVPGFYFSQISNLKSPIRGFIFRKPGFIFRKISHILVCFYTVNSQKCPKYPKIFARSARGFIFRKSQISNSRFGVLFFANLKYKIPYRGFKKGGFIHIMAVTLHVRRFKVTEIDLQCTKCSLAKPLRSLFCNCADRNFHCTTVM